MTIDEEQFFIELGMGGIGIESVIKFGAGQALIGKEQPNYLAPRLVDIHHCSGLIPHALFEFLWRAIVKSFEKLIELRHVRDSDFVANFQYT